MVVAPLSFALALLAVPVHAAGAQHGHPSAVDPDSLEAELTAQLDRVRRATARFRDIEVARDEGYRRFGRGEQPLMGEHWYRKDLVTEPLDLERPSTLMYARVDGEPVLLGVAYTVYRRPDEPLPEGFAGEHDLWHAHDVHRLVRAITADRPLLRRLAERRLERADELSGGRTQLTMVHAWVWLDNPAGVFALRHLALPYVKAGLPAAWAAGADESAARGVSLLQPAACRDDVAALHRMARLSRTQRRSLETSCEEAAESVREARERATTAAAVNAEAAAAWRRYAAARAVSLTPEQRERRQRFEDHVSHGGVHEAHGP